MVIKIEIKKGKNLLKKDMDLMNKARIKEFGKGEIKNWKKDYPLTTNYFFVKDRKKVMAFGLLRPIKIRYINKNYNILGICSIISIKKGRGYGEILIESMINYPKKKNKTGLGFTGKTKFFKKVGLKTKKDFIKRFKYRNPRTSKIKIDNDGDGIYYNGQDNFIKKVLSTKLIIYINIDFW